jgi:hypothetical protein
MRNTRRQLVAPMKAAMKVLSRQSAGARRVPIPFHPPFGFIACSPISLVNCLAQLG